MSIAPQIEELPLRGVPVPVVRPAAELEAGDDGDCAAAAGDRALQGDPARAQVRAGRRLLGAALDRDVRDPGDAAEGAILI